MPSLVRKPDVFRGLQDGDPKRYQPNCTFSVDFFECLSPSSKLANIYFLSVAVLAQSKLPQFLNSLHALGCPLVSARGSRYRWLLQRSADVLDSELPDWARRLRGYQRQLRVDSAVRPLRRRAGLPASLLPRGDLPLRERDFHWHGRRGKRVCSCDRATFACGTLFTTGADDGH